MNLTTIFVIISSVLMLVSAVPYLIGIVNGRTKPRIVSWLVWVILGTITCIATFVDRQYPTAIFLICLVVGPLTVVILGWERGNRKIGRFDIVCLVGAIVGIILWQIFNSPSIVVLAMIVIDIIGGLPTLRHSWNNPSEEQWMTFVLCSLGSFFTLLTVTDWRITAFAWPMFQLIINSVFALIVLVRKHVLRTKKKKR